MKKRILLRFKGDIEVYADAEGCLWLRIEQSNRKEWFKSFDLTFCFEKVSAYGFGEGYISPHTLTRLQMLGNSQVFHPSLTPLFSTT